MSKQPKTLPVVSVAPVRRPKLDASGNQYAFKQERELMAEKMKTILRIAAHCRHRNVCMGAFGTGPQFRNPTREVAEMWRDLLFEDPEFFGCFQSIVFAVDVAQAGSLVNQRADVQTFEDVFNPEKIFYRARH
jgi:uncharacterized protein (TIGR02452 family)